ncbi:hypothetical protein T12_8715 [Trichinella patagoniensis]|uniref:Uncharacterized protein n=1 Tax=Trichinella patagoniensis TaxID=990121 RepID=A0A0V0Z564_9BILA|nr:hypothetical protein T12_11124 [Trichinella patagoniensis]KRY08741.1 hypothetical protein T12_10159 [Trichinella patagoniensis]KRY20370.1 hypothetical protein T12_8715 [Trichinella patagoniensis]
MDGINDSFVARFESMISVVSWVRCTMSATIIPSLGSPGVLMTPGQRGTTLVNRPPTSRSLSISKNEQSEAIGLLFVREFPAISSLTSTRLESRSPQSGRRKSRDRLHTYLTKPCQREARETKTNTCFLPQKSAHIPIFWAKANLQIHLSDVYLDPNSGPTKTKQYRNQIRLQFRPRVEAEV